MSDQLQTYAPGIVDAVRAIILKHLQPTRIYLFGSRVTGDAKPESDYDFAFDAPQCPPGAIDAIRAELDELPTLAKIDVTNIANADRRFSNRVRDMGLVRYSATAPGSGWPALLPSRAGSIPTRHYRTIPMG